MATSGKPLDNRIRSTVIRWRARGRSMREIARLEHLSLTTVYKILHESGERDEAIYGSGEK